MVQPEFFHLTFPSFQCCLRPFYRLIMRQYLSRPSGRWNFKPFHIYTLNILKFCFLVDFRIGPRWMAAFIDGVINILHIDTFVLHASIENVALVAGIPNFFRKHWKILLVCWWFVYSMFFNSGDDAASFLELVELEFFSLSSLSAWFWSSCTSCLDAYGTFSCRLVWENPTSEFE